MLEKVKFIQETKVDELLQLEQIEGEKEYFLKAPTGSGKTYMEGYLISQLIKKYPNCKIIYQSLSKAELTQQSAENIIKYGFESIKPYILTTEISDQESISIPTNYNVYFLPRDLNREKGLLKTPLKDFLQYKTKNDIKFLIIDECHEAHKNIDEYYDEFERVYGFSATPTISQLRPGRYVELEDNLCVEEELIKRKEFVHINNPLFPDEKKTSEVDEWIIKKVNQSINDFKKIKKDYEGSGINPALIIQISNKFKGEKQKKIITDILDKEGMLWYYRDANGYNSSDKINELKGASREKAWTYVKNNSSNIDVIIFKLAINTGVDIPRACYLLQIRNTRSETLDEQVIGRIRRNPVLKEWDNVDDRFKNNLLIAYINGVEQQETRQVKYVKRIRNVEFKTTILKNKIPTLFRKIDKNLIGEYKGGIKDIFQLKEDWDRIDGKIKNEYKNITKNEWIQLCLNVNILNNSSFENDYSNNLKISSNASLQETTFYRVDPQMIRIEHWNWKNCDNDNDDIYSFESLAEMQVAEELNELGLTLWGKNWYNGSHISYEYFLRQKGNYLISKQHPDFFVVKNNKKYLIEVKSFDGINQTNIGYQDYFDKVESIKKIYKEISKITDQVMVVIVKDQGNWISYVYEKDKDIAIYKNRDKYNFLK